MAALFAAIFLPKISQFKKNQFCINTLYSCNTFLTKYNGKGNLWSSNAYKTDGYDLLSP